MRCRTLLLLLLMTLICGPANAKRRQRRKPVPTVTVLTASPDGETWVRRGRKGIISTRDTAGIVRSMTPPNPNAPQLRLYAEAISAFADSVAADSIKVYSLIAPSQGEFYLPQQYAHASERRAIAAAYRALRGVQGIDVADTLQAHIAEEIYLRTDHHWAPLGAYYAGRELARQANVPYRQLTEYQPDTIHGFVGTMAKFSGDDLLKNFPQDLIYYRPLTPDTLRAHFTTCGPKVKADTATIEPFFKPFDDGSPLAYCVFMGGDYVSVKMEQPGSTSSRRLLMVKDSYGNALAPCLFGSFDQVHIIDFRYFPHNIIDYCRHNGITDVLFINCISLAQTPSTVTKLRGLYTTPSLQ